MLRELELPREALAWLLAAFNVGVVWQVTIILLALPLLSALWRFASFQVSQVILTALACLVMLTGSVWLWQRLLL